MTKRIIHSADHLLVEVNRLRSLHKIYVPSKARDRLRRDIHNMVQQAIDAGLIQAEERTTYMGPELT
jgi:hypothetical protein